MNTNFLIIAHAPLAHALRECALHVFPDCADEVLALDVPPDEAPEQTLYAARALLARHGQAPVLVLSDLFGATPCNVARSLLGDASQARLIAGVNLPMLLRAVCYRAEPLDALVARALAGGTQGMLLVAAATESHPTCHP
ncbi:MAG: PTS fructose transporter subunit IIA [Comamonadaceae bacterium]|nr:PTS fructose transporter subunit IIA [Comamonadaceae bacterium]